MTKALSKRDAFLQDFSKSRDYIAGMLPAGTDPDRFMRICQTEVLGNPKLLECDKRSLLQAVALAARSGLEVGGGSMAQAHLIPRKGWACFEPNFKGHLQLAMNSQSVASVQVDSVHALDEFRKDGPKYIHRVDLQGERGPIVGFICWVTLRTGGVQATHMTKAEINEIRDRYGYAEGLAWKNSWQQMACKTILKRALKGAQFTPEQTALLSDVDAQTPLQEDYTEISPDDPRAQPGAAGLAARLAAQSGEEREPPAETPEEPSAPQETAQDLTGDITAKRIAEVQIVLRECGYEDEANKRALYQRAIKKLFNRVCGLSEITEGQGQALARFLRVDENIRRVGNELEQDAHAAAQEKGEA